MLAQRANAPATYASTAVPPIAGRLAGCLAALLAPGARRSGRCLAGVRAGLARVALGLVDVALLLLVAECVPAPVRHQHQRVELLGGPVCAPVAGHQPVSPAG